MVAERSVRKAVSEIFSPPKVSAQAQLVGLRPGFAIDLEAKREDGEHWGLSKDSQIEDLFTRLDNEKPTLLGSFRRFTAMWTVFTTSELG